MRFLTLSNIYRLGLKELQSLRADKVLLILLMPGHFECCTVPVLHWLAERPGIRVSLLTQYLAPAQARGELADTLNQSDIDRAMALAQGLKLDLVS